MRASALTAVFLSVFIVAVVTVPGCGSDDPPAKEKKQGDGEECGGLVCDDVILPFGNPPIEACCPDQGGCGLDGTQFEQYGAHFDDPCQPKNQPGELDSECLRSPPIPTEQLGDIFFEGCCTAAGRCGYMLNTVATIVKLDLGCVDAEPFLDAGVPPSCTPGPGGGGGAGGGGP